MLSSVVLFVSWLSRGPDSSGEAWIGCKRFLLKLSEVLLAMEVKGPYMHANRRLILIQNWCHTRDFQLTLFNESILRRNCFEIAIFL